MGVRAGNQELILVLRVQDPRQGLRPRRVPALRRRACKREQAHSFSRISDTLAAFVQEVVCIHGGAITQLEQREMPAILRNARADAELCGVRCFLEVKPMSFCDFYQRFAPPEIDAD